MPKKPEPQELPGVEGPGVSIPKFKDLDRLADRFIEIRDQKAELAEKLGDLDKQIAEKMTEHGLSRYKFSDQEVILKPGKTHVKINTVKAGSSEPASED
jgi:hypothetical protein